MEVKKGQWVRTEYGIFHQIEEVLHGDWVILKNGYGMKIDDLTIKNTPQELIKRDDLIKIKRRTGNLSTPFVVSDNYKEHCACYEDFKSIKHIEIVQILTPNSKGGYDLQWEAKQMKCDKCGSERINIVHAPYWYECEVCSYEISLEEYNQAELDKLLSKMKKIKGNEYNTHTLALITVYNHALSIGYKEGNFYLQLCDNVSCVQKPIGYDTAKLIIRDLEAK